MVLSPGTEMEPVERPCSRAGWRVRARQGLGVKLHGLQYSQGFCSCAHSSIQLSSFTRSRPHTAQRGILSLTTGVFLPLTSGVTEEPQKKHPKSFPQSLLHLSKPISICVCLVSKTPCVLRLSGPMPLVVHLDLESTQLKAKQEMWNKHPSQRVRKLNEIQEKRGPLKY